MTTIRDYNGVNYTKIHINDVFQFLQFLWNILFFVPFCLLYCKISYLIYAFSQAIIKMILWQYYNNLCPFSIADSLSPEVAFLIVNALYFKASWSVLFDEARCSKLQSFLQELSLFPLLKLTNLKWGIFKITSFK